MKQRRFLTKGLYEKDRRPLFFLKNEQIRSKRDTLIRNAGWYNDFGQKLGLGDLDGADLLRIYSNIPHGEYFIALYEDAARRFDISNPRKSKTSRANLIRETRYIIGTEGIFSICHERNNRLFQYEVNHLIVCVLTESEALSMIEKAQAKITWI